MDGQTAGEREREREREREMEGEDKGTYHRQCDYDGNTHGLQCAVAMVITELYFGSSSYEKRPHNGYIH